MVIIRKVIAWGTFLLFLRGILPLGEHIQFIYQILEWLKSHKDLPVIGPLLNLSGSAYLVAVVVILVVFVIADRAYAYRLNVNINSVTLTPKQPEAQPPQPPPPIQDVNPLDAHFSRRVIRMADLIVNVAHPIIENKVFEDCEIFGPAIVYGIEGVLLDQSNLNGTPDALFIEVPPDRVAIGVIGLKNVTIRRCNLYGIGFLHVKGQIKGNTPGLPP
jgi:hypothetical protein